MLCLRASSTDHVNNIKGHKNRVGAQEGITPTLGPIYEYDTAALK